MAKKFTFRFESALQLRRQKEQLSRQRFMRALADESAALAAMERLTQMLGQLDHRVARNLAEAGSLGMDGYQMAQGLRAHAACRHRRDTLGRQTSLCREQLLRDMKARQAVGRLKERLHAGHRVQAARAATRESDDLYAMFRSANRISDGGVEVLT